MDNTYKHPREDRHNRPDLCRLADLVDAQRIDDHRWAYHDDAMRRWYVVTDDAIESLGEYCDYPRPDDPQLVPDSYSLWCADTWADDMPEGWHPDDARRKFALTDLLEGELLPDGSVRFWHNDRKRETAEHLLVRAWHAWADYRLDQWIGRNSKEVD